MSLPLLTTKFYFPSARPSLVPRPRLVERLKVGLSGSLTLISAPAGYGKTTLMSEWRAGVGHDYPAAWLSLDVDDNGTTSFFTYFIAAITTLKPGFGKTTLALLQSSPPLPDRVILSSLINELGAFDKPFSLILDDYHVITANLIHEAVTYLLDHLPLQMHLVILTRADPPLPLSRMRARNQLVEIRASDLRFAEEEANEFLNKSMGLALSTDQVDALERRTEGWVAGLQLAALSMQGREDIQKFITEFSGSHHYIVDFLGDEVLNHLPEAIQQFLLRTSILERLTASLCDTLTGREDGQAILEWLEHANLFLVPLDNEQRWYRYHNLFLEVLRKRLGQDCPGLILELHHSAAQWYEQNQLIEKAIDHTFVIKDYDQVVRLIRQYYLYLMVPSNVMLIWHWAQMFPEDYIRENPWLSTYYAWFLWNRGTKDEVESYLNFAQEALDRMIVLGQFPKQDPGFDILPAEILCLRAEVCASRGELELARKLSMQALALAPETAYTVRSIIDLNLSHVYRDQGDIKKAIDLSTRALPLAKIGGEKSQIIYAFRNLALVYTIQGDLRRASQIYRDGIEYAEKNWQPNFPTSSVLMVELAEIYYEWDELDKAEHLATKAARLGEPAYWWVTIYGRILLARINRVRNNISIALKHISEAESLLHQLSGANFEEEIRLYLVREQAELGETNEATRWLQTVKFRAGACLSYPEYILAFQLAYVFSALGRIDELLALLSVIEPLCAAQGCTYWQIRALVLFVVVWQKKKDNNRAFAYLEKVLSLAEKEGYIRVFLDQGAVMINLLHQAAAKGVYPDYVSRLLSAKYQVAEKAPQTQPLVEPLSERELEVLRLVSDGASNNQIAQALYIANGTVKKHINNIFGKLGVQRRTECVAKARELKLL